MKILITGANGLLGSNVARELIRAGEDVKLFVRPMADLRSVADLPCEIIYGDIQDAEEVLAAVKNVDAVIHAASSTDMVSQPFEHYESVNVNGTTNIVRAMLAFPGKRLIYVSTSNTFAPGNKRTPGNELNSFSFFNYDSGYINSKYIAQQMVIESVEKQNLDAVIVNPTFMIGAYDTKPSSGKIILFGLKSGVKWCPPGGRNFVNVRDVAKGIHKALHHGKKGHCYLLAGENLSFKEFFHTVSKVTGEKIRMIVVPEFIMLAAGMIGSVLNSLHLRKVWFSLTNIRLLTIGNYYSGAKAASEFNLQPTPVKHAIEEAVEWFNNNGYIK